MKYAHGQVKHLIRQWEKGGGEFLLLDMVIEDDLIRRG